jgi:hypothetical protein
MGIRFRNRRRELIQLAGKQVTFNPFPYNAIPNDDGGDDDDDNNNLSGKCLAMAFVFRQ